MRDRAARYLATEGTHSVDWLPPRARQDHVGRTAAWPATGQGLEHAIEEIPALHEDFETGVRVLGDGETLNQSLEKARRVDDFFELAQLMCRDALHREESCGGHFREEHQTPDGEALRDDEHFAYVAAWEYTGDPPAPMLHASRSSSSTSRPTQRSYT